MIIEDRVYGSVEITDPLLVELIESPALQRLKGVSMAGYTAMYNPKATATRYEHSVGVLLLLKKYGASLEEQTAGLIHDVSHGAFSHTLDYVLAETGVGQDYQDSIQEAFVRERTTIPEILMRHGLKIEDALDDTRHPLKESSLPDLCADRLDYTLHNGVDLELMTKKQIEQILASLKVEKTTWVFSDVATARLFSEKSWELSRDWYAGFATAIMFKSTADYLRYALAEKYVTVEGLYVTDAEVLSRVNAYLNEDAELARLWKRMNDASGWKNDPAHQEARIVCKSRMVDPLVKTERGLERLSALQPDWGEIVKNESMPREWFPTYAA